MGADGRSQGSLRTWMKQKAKEEGGQSRFAERSGLSRPLVNQFINGDKALGEDALATLQDAYPEATPHILKASKLSYGTTPPARLIATIAELLDPELQITLLQIALGLHKVSRQQVERALTVEEYEALLQLAHDHPEVTDDVLARTREDESTPRKKTLVGT